MENATKWSTWHRSSSTSQGSPPRHSPCWQPLGGAWRDSENSCVGRVRNNVDEGSEYLHGVVPNWDKETRIRMRAAVAHELSWAYYRTRRHPEHPLRVQLDEALENAPYELKVGCGKKNLFQFWAHVRPPFTVTSMHRVDEPEDRHPNGILYRAAYQCGIEYGAEHQKNTGSNGVYDNKVYGVAMVRLSNEFPKTRPMVIVGWGCPSFNPPSAGQSGAGDDVDPSGWVPLGEELSKKPNDKSMDLTRQLMREATQKMKQNKDRLEVPKIQKLLMSPHTPKSLNMFAQCESHNSRLLMRRRSLSSPGLGRRPSKCFLQDVPSAAGPKRRQHTICTALGFVKYAG